MTPLCACGRPLHYTTSIAKAFVDGEVARLGENIKVALLDQGGAYMVPRHYIALHGLIGGELPFLAKKFGWERAQ